MEENQEKKEKIIYFERTLIYTPTAKNIVNFKEFVCFLTNDTL